MLGKVCQGPKNIQELSQIFRSIKNEGCFGAQVSEKGFREENEYFSFMKNIHLIIFGIYQRDKVEWGVDRQLGESLGYAQVTSPFEMIPKFKLVQDKNQVRKQREGKIQAVTSGYGDS